MPMRQALRLYGLHLTPMRQALRLCSLRLRGLMLRRG